MGEAKRRKLIPPKCRGCDTPLTPDQDSEAHVFPNALSGRLKPKGIICRTCNGTLGKLADDALVKAFGDWPTLLDLPRDRGKAPSTTTKTKDGKTIRLNPDGSMRMMDVLYRSAAIGDAATQLTIGAGAMKTIRQLLVRAKK